VITFQTQMQIERSIDQVFAYLADPLNFPRWNSAVQTVRKTSGGGDGTSSAYAMERRLPAGRAVNTLEIVACERPREFAIRTTAGPTPFLYRYRLSGENGSTIVTLDAQVELGGVAALVPGLAQRAVRSGVEENLATLRAILEAW
jgi:uncharacterized protein YndB with AHSA1/START domain